MAQWNQFRKRSIVRKGTEMTTGKSVFAPVPIAWVLLGTLGWLLAPHLGSAAALWLVAAASLLLTGVVAYKMFVTLNPWGDLHQFYTVVGFYTTAAMIAHNALFSLGYQVIGMLIAAGIGAIGIISARRHYPRHLIG